VQLCLKREVLARETPSKGYHTRRWHKELATTQHQGVQPFTVLQGSLARWVLVGGRVSRLCGQQQQQGWGMFRQGWQG